MRTNASSSSARTKTRAAAKPAATVVSKSKPPKRTVSTSVAKPATKPKAAAAPAPTATRSPAQPQQESLDVRLAEALVGEGRMLARVSTMAPTSRLESLRVLNVIYNGLTQPVTAECALGSAARLASHPAVMGLKWRLESSWLEELSRRAGVVDSVPETNATEGLRTLVAALPEHPMYGWLAKQGSAESLVSFIAGEGGPDDGLVELLATAQAGASATYSVGLARLIWEMAGEGVQARSRVQAHQAARVALGIARAGDRVSGSLIGQAHDLSETALERRALRGMLETNPGLRPELLGYIAMILLQAPARCEQMLKAMRRLRVPSEAMRLYEALTEPHSRAGATFVAEVIKPAVRECPDWSHRVIRGARWRASLETELLDELYSGLRDGSIGAPRAA